MCLCFYMKKLKAPGRRLRLLSAARYSLGTENKAQKRTADPLDISFVRMICGCFSFSFNFYIFKQEDRVLRQKKKKKRIEVYLNRPA